MNAKSFQRPRQDRSAEVLGQIAGLLQTQPRIALERAEALLLQAPELAPAELLACQALRLLGKSAAALPRLEKLALRQANVPVVHWELAQAAMEKGATQRAITALETLTRMQPAVSSGWFLLARALRAASREEDAWRADLSGVHASGRDPELVKGAMAMNAQRLDDGIALIKARLARSGEDAPAVRLLAEMQWRRGDMGEALEQAQKAVELAPGFDLARDFLIRLLLQNNRLHDALAHAEVLVRSPVETPAHALILASVLVRLGDHARAEELYRTILAQRSEQPQVWQNLGHVLKTMGKQADAIGAYREAVSQLPTMGEAWWSLANLKTARLDGDDIAVIEAALASIEPGNKEHEEDVYHLHFALGKAYEDARDYQKSFVHYDQGNRLRRALIPHDPEAFSAEVRATAETFSAAFLAGVGAGGCEAADPIFVVGLPRSGSTLVEQILASHSLIEGTLELPEMMIIAGRLQSRVDEGEFPDFRTMVSSLSQDDRLRLGEEYIEKTRVHRKTDKPLFIDKMPNNWQHVGLIRMVLPNARIIDARRHPMACCFSGWKQHFARGQTFTYDLADIARYYRDYVGLMAAFDIAAPGAVHRVFYEEMVRHTEREIRSLLNYLGVPFEQACLEFHANERAVRTASSEQVRQPIFTSGMDAWKKYEDWLAPLSEALHPIEELYPFA